jgi:hypothetical protein
MRCSRTMVLITILCSSAADAESYYIRSATGRYLDVSGGDPGLGVPVQIWDFHGGDGQIWDIETRADYFMIRSRLGRFLDVQWASDQPATPVWTWDFNDRSASSTCGGVGQPCCSGNACGWSLTCAAGSCQSQGAQCGTTRCSTGQSCLTDCSGHPTCVPSGSTCCSPASAGQSAVVCGPGQTCSFFGGTPHCI